MKLAGGIVHHIKANDLSLIVVILFRSGDNVAVLTNGQGNQTFRYANTSLARAKVVSMRPYHKRLVAVLRSKA